MAWNRSSENGEAVSRPLQKRKGFRFPVRGAIAGAIVVLGAAVAAWWLWPDTSAPVAEDGDGTAGRRIREVTPAAAPKAEEAKPKDPPGYWNGKKITNENRPPWMSPYHTVNDYGHIHTNKPNEALKPIWEKVFSNETDQEIAAFLLVEPGEYVLGDGAGSFKDFDAYFLESIKEPIIVRTDDDEYVKELKRAVIQTKIELKDRLDRGESLEAIMEKTQSEFRELGLYKEELKEQVEELCKKDAVSEADVEDYVTAANKMLEERGCAPFTLPAFYKRSLLLKTKAHTEGAKQ